MLNKIISGGQTGVDQAGLRAAKKCGFATGGWLPKGCITQKGARYDFLETYGMKEHSSFGYPGRTESNVKDSDATIRLAVNFKSPGEICTFKAIKWHNKPHLDVNINEPISIDEVVSWLVKNNVVTLNIAGNAESTSPGIGEKAENYIVEILRKYKENSMSQN